MYHKSSSPNNFDVDNANMFLVHWGNFEIKAFEVSDE